MKKTRYWIAGMAAAIASYGAQIEAPLLERGVMRYPDEWRTANGTNYNIAPLRSATPRNLAAAKQKVGGDWEMIGGKYVAKLGKGYVIELRRSVSVSNGRYPPLSTVEVSGPAFVMNREPETYEKERFYRHDWALKIGVVNFENRPIPAFDFGVPLKPKSPAPKEGK